MRLFLEPRSVVLVGVTRRTGSGAYNGLEMMRRFGYAGRIFLVHPQAEEILGETPFPTVLDLPETPDLAVLTVGRDRVPGVLDQCGQKGIRRVIVVSQGFADADGVGAALQADLVARAKAAGIRLLGPNTMGVLNAHRQFSTAFLDLPCPAPAPPLSLVAQSGVFQVGPEEFIGTLGKAIDIGNTADVDAVDCLDYLVDDPETRVIALYLEGIHRGAALVQAVARAAARKPVVILKAGRSAAGAQAALSHTGSLVGEDAVVDAAFARAGAVRVPDITTFRAACRGLQHFSGMAGPQVAIVTCTGAAGILGADALEEHGLRLAPFPPALREELALPRMAWHRLDNPADIWPVAMGSGDYIGFLKGTVAGLVADPEVHGLVCVLVCKDSPLHADHDLVAAAQDLAAANPEGKPIALWLYGSGAPRQTLEINALDLPGVAAFDTLDSAVKALAAARQRTQRLRDLEAAAVAPPAAKPSAASAAPATPRAPLPPGELLVGLDAHAFLTDYGVTFAPGGLVDDPEAAVAAAEAVGFPVVLKVVSPDWLHKTDRGGVALGLQDAAAVRAAAATLLGRFHTASPGGRLLGLLVQPQLQGVELLCGVKRDPHFGPVVVVGQGGIHAEVFRDVAYGLAPLGPDEPERLLASLRLAPLLAGARGQPPVDRVALHNLIRALSDVASDHPALAELDLNPVIATPDGAFAVDARLVVRPAGNE